MPFFLAFTDFRMLANSPETGYQTDTRRPVKPFGNSQKGIWKGRLTWIFASDKYPGIK
jgi:hypothetical protein